MQHIVKVITNLEISYDIEGIYKYATKTLLLRVNHFLFALYQWVILVPDSWKWSDLNKIVLQPHLINFSIEVLYVTSPSPFKVN